MSVPRSYEMCRPLLAVLGDGRQHTLEEIERSIIQHFALGPEDLVERTRRGGESVFQHRLRWIKEYLLDNMGLMEASEDGTFIITPDGLEVLRHAPAVIDFKYLRRYKGIRDFRKKHEGEDIPDDIDLLMQDDDIDDELQDEEAPTIEEPAEFDVSPRPEEPAELDVSPAIEGPAELDMSPALEEPAELDMAPTIEGPAELDMAPTIEGPAELDMSPTIEEPEEPDMSPTIEGPAELDMSPRSEEHSDSPEERMELAMRELDDALAGELLREASALSQAAFERLAIDLLSRMGYRAFGTARHTAETSGDAGIHGIIIDDEPGLPPIYVRAHRSSVGETIDADAIRDLADTVSARGGKGLLVTTAAADDEVKAVADDLGLLLMDGDRMARLAIANDLCVDVRRTFTLKSLDADAFATYEDDRGALVR